MKVSNQFKIALLNHDFKLTVAYMFNFGLTVSEVPFENRFILAPSLFLLQKFGQVDLSGGKRSGTPKKESGTNLSENFQTFFPGLVGATKMSNLIDFL